MTKLVFWHGWGTNPQVWEGLIGSLRKVLPADTDYEAAPLPGYAGTALPAGDGKAVWAAAMMEKQSGPLVLVGWSMGAIMALQAAYHYPEKISHLVLFGATPCFAQKPDWPHGISEKARENFKNDIHSDPATALRNFVLLFNRKDKQARAIIRKLSHKEMPPVPPIPILDAGLHFLYETDLRPILPFIQQKTLLIHGEYDPLMPPEAAKLISEKLPAARMHILPQTAHVPFLSDPEQCAMLIKQFLDTP